MRNTHREEIGQARSFLHKKNFYYPHQNRIPVGDFYSNLEPIKFYIKPNKQGAKRHYGAHPYFTRRPWNVVQNYIEHFSEKENCLICDPFGGSGVTLIESLILKRKCIHIDINPLANFIAKQIAISPVNLEYLGEAFNKVKEKYFKYFLHPEGQKNLQEGH